MLVTEEKYITIQGWMVTDLKLHGNELLVYAIIYGFSQDENTKFTGSIQYLADWTGATKRTIYNILNELTEKGIIKKYEYSKNGIKFCEYASNFTSGEKISLGGEKISPNTIDDNIDINNNYINKSIVLDEKISPVVKKKTTAKPQNEDDFNMFWEQYPRKVNKEEAKKSFFKIKDLDKQFDLIFYALNRFKQTEWKTHLVTKDGLQYIPHASTWLNQARYKDFEDEYNGHTPIKETQQFNNSSFNAEDFMQENINKNIKNKSLRRMEQEKFIADLGLEEAKRRMPSLYSDYEG